MLQSESPSEKMWAAALLILLLSLKCPDLRSRYSNVFESHTVPFAACTPSRPTLGALRQTVGIKTATKARCEIIPSPVLSSDIHYQNYGHHGLFPVITLRLAGAGLAIGRLFWWPGLNSQQGLEHRYTYWAGSYTKRQRIRLRSYRGTAFA